MTERQKQEIYKEYSANNMKKLRQIIYKTFSIFGGLYQMDFDDFLSRANLELWHIVESFDDTVGVPFEAYLRKRIPLKIMQEKTYAGRDRRTQYLRDKNGEKIKDEFGRYIEIQKIYIDAPSEDGVDLSEKLPSAFNLEEALIENSDEQFSENMQKYLSKLSKKQRAVATLLSEGYKPEEIREILHITNKQYTDCMMAIRSYDNTKILK